MSRFDDQFHGVPESEPEEPRTGSINPFEIALWAVAVVLVVGGVVSLHWATGRYGGGSVATNSESFVATQMVYALAPAAVAAGLFAIVVALALRAALLVIARRAAVSATSELRRAALSAATSSVESRQSAPISESAPQPEPLSFEPPRFRQRQRAIDHSAFKRPGTE
ncbi:hypothetical protein SAMN06295879_1949 [Agreia bicolorata]|uniref:Uncharacterized protein n=1 Tax=Agreia bicolorata TaxID=110935 RepID=A0A1T4XY24_9MICO|nr:hypothetical protein [Agreia bicolorata]SKA94430.1 hypothetical protein SAMN06295879_1949 [Agreia bicolorata]